MDLNEEILALAKELNDVWLEEDVREAAYMEVKKVRVELQIKLGHLMERIPKKKRNFDVVGVGRIGTRTIFGSKIVDPEALKEHLRNDSEGRAMLTVNYGALMDNPEVAEVLSRMEVLPFALDFNKKRVDSFLKERMESGGDLPPAEIVDLTNFTETRAVIRGREGAQPTE